MDFIQYLHACSLMDMVTNSPLWVLHYKASIVLKVEICTEWFHIPTSSLVIIFILDALTMGMDASMYTTVFLIKYKRN